MKPRAFAYACVGSLDEALALLAEHGEDAKIIAGGQSLVPMMNMRLASPAVLVDVGRIPGLRDIAFHDGVLGIGALARHRDVQVSSDVHDHVPILSMAVEFVAHMAVRNRGTFGGSLCHADPSAEFPACALLLRAELEVASVRGRRTIPASEFFLGAFTTALRPDEMLTGVRIANPSAQTTFRIDEVSRRQGDFATAGIAASIEETEDGRLIEIVGFGCGDRPVRLPCLSEEMSGPGAVSAGARRIEQAIEEDLEEYLEGEPRALCRTLMQALVARQFDPPCREAA